MTVGIVVFPGSNCDHDLFHVCQEVMGFKTRYIWYQETNLKDVKVVLLPGGFSYGDYLRAGAIARYAPIMDALRDFAEEGKPILGICNGFQILLEAHFLPGAMLPNRYLKFLCQDVYLKVESPKPPFTHLYQKGEVIRLPIAHMEGNFYTDGATLQELEKEGFIAFRYVSPEGVREDESPKTNPNGSMASIAGLTNGRGNILGLMPHPERAAEAILGNTDGYRIFQGIKEYLT